jgi:excinuclease ABC subunit A
LKKVDVRFPLGCFTCVTGVSGSGKSSLITETLYPALARLLHRAQERPGAYDRLDGLDSVDKVIHITQDPIGRTPRSNPATYVKVWDDIRNLFAETPEAKARGYKPGRFSFNVKGGRCEACQGHGQKLVEMHFLPDVWVTCDVCKGLRFNRETLQIRYKGKNIAEALDMDVAEALGFFNNIPRIKRILTTLHDVGLDYIKLGQSATTLSGGEAQRVKLAKELSRVATGDTVYILDEPTTGLHFADIQKLLDVLHRLTDAGNTVIVIEHNLDVIKSADWLIDLGPEGGDEGGQIIAAGTPEAVAMIDSSYTGQFLRRVLQHPINQL